MTEEIKTIMTTTGTTVEVTAITLYAGKAVQSCTFVGPAESKYRLAEQAVHDICAHILLDLGGNEA